MRERTRTGCGADVYGFFEICEFGCEEPSATLLSSQVSSGSSAAARVVISFEAADFAKVPVILATVILDVEPFTGIGG